MSQELESRNYHYHTTQTHRGVLVKNNHDSGAPGASAQGVSSLKLEPSKAAKKRCQGTKKNGAACTAWAMEGGLCYFHANPDKAAELGRNGGRHRKHTYEQSSERVAPPESPAAVRRMLAETMAAVKAGRMDPKIANTIAYVGTVLLRAYEADAAPECRYPSPAIRAADLSLTDIPGRQEASGRRCDRPRNRRAGCTTGRPSAVRAPSSPSLGSSN